MNFESTSDDLIDGAQLLPWPTFPVSPSISPVRKNMDLDESPMSMALTEFHFILLYKNRLVGVSNLNEQLTYEEILPMVCIFVY